MAITRPFTAVALGLPIIIVVLVRTWGKGLWGDLVAPTLLGMALLSLLPVWALRVTGSWTDLPVTRYTADYLPFDRLGFGLDTTPPRRHLPNAYVGLITGFSELHEAHTWENLPEIARVRVERLRHAAWSGWRRWLAPAFLVGLFVLPGPGLVAVGSVFAYLGVMLAYAHPSSWTLYYSELAPLVAFFTAAGVAGAPRMLRRRAGGSFGEGSTLWAVGAAIALLPLLGLGVKTDIRRARATRDHELQSVIAFHEAMRAVPGPAIVFVRYPADHARHDVLVANPADLATARYWVVHDLGARNGDLAALAPERRAFLWDEGSGTLQPWADNGPQPASGPDRPHRDQ